MSLTGSREFSGRISRELDVDSFWAVVTGNVDVVESGGLDGAGGELRSGGGDDTRYLAMKPSMSRRAATLEAGSGGHDATQ